MCLVCGGNVLGCFDGVLMGYCWVWFWIRIVGLCVGISSGYVGCCRWMCCSC